MYLQFPPKEPLRDNSLFTEILISVYPPFPSVFTCGKERVGELLFMLWLLIRGSRIKEAKAYESQAKQEAGSQRQAP